MSPQSRIRFQAGSLLARLLSVLLDALDEGIDGLCLDALIDISRIRHHQTGAAWARAGRQLRRNQNEWQAKQRGGCGNSRPPRSTLDDWIRAAIRNRVSGELRRCVGCFQPPDKDGRRKLTDQARTLVAPIARDRLAAVEQCQRDHIDCGCSPSKERICVSLPQLHPCELCGTSLIGGRKRFCDGCQAAKRRIATRKYLLRQKEKGGTGDRLPKIQTGGTTW